MKLIHKRQRRRRQLKTRYVRSYSRCSSGSSEIICTPAPERALNQSATDQNSSALRGASNATEPIWPMLREWLFYFWFLIFRKRADPNMMPTRAEQNIFRIYKHSGYPCVRASLPTDGHISTYTQSHIHICIQSKYERNKQTLESVYIK